MTKKIVLAALLGGIIMFLWEGLAHEVLPLGQAGVRGLDNEAAVMASLKDNVKQEGFYFFPGAEAFKPGLTGAQKQEAMKKVTEQWRTGPSGIMVVHPEGLPSESGMQLATQCVLDILVTLIAAWLLAKAPLGSYASRVIFVTALGLIPTINAELPLWNWYGFPSAYIASQGLVHLVGFLLAGLIVAKLVKSGASQPAAARAAA